MSETERMFASSVPVKLVLQPELPEIEHAQEWLLKLEEQVLLPDIKCKRIAICVDEILSNIIQYSQATSIELLFLADEDEISLIFRDNGIAFNPLERAEPNTLLPLEQRPIGGLGILVTRKFMDRTDYCYEDGWNVFTATMSKA